jgi:hypothetical protein
MIIPDTLLDVPELQEEYPDFKAVTDCDKQKIGPDMEVTLRSNGEDFIVKVDEVTDTYLTGKVLTETFYFTQPFEYLDFIQFERKNVIDINPLPGIYY